MKKPVIAVSVGCPSGVGPEVAVVAAAKMRDARVILVGDPGTLERAAVLRRVARKRLVLVEDPAADGRGLKEGSIGVFAASARLQEPAVFGKPSREAGAAQLAWVDQATDLVTSGAAQALVTGPVSKYAIATSSSLSPAAAGFRGHTEHLAERLGAAEVVMSFWSRELTTALVTTHLQLARVPDAITPEAVAMSTYWVSDLVLTLGKKKPRVAIAALNPHAGEGGLLGDEETTRIRPGIELARARLAAKGRAVEIIGPLGAETAIRLGARGDFDAVVCMYHDQATIPMKVLGFGEAVNVTLGLPIVRTSVDHGTGYDVAGTGKADARGMREALALAVRLARA